MKNRHHISNKMSMYTDITTYSQSMVCSQDIKSFTSKRQREMFIRLHNKVCEQCRNAPQYYTIAPVNTDNYLTAEVNGIRRNSVQDHLDMVTRLG